MILLSKALKKITYYLNPRLYLKIIFRFQNWHLSPYSNKKYCHLIIEELNKKEKRESALDLGCGLGDILIRLNYNRKLGIDVDQNVIRAAHFWNYFRFFQFGKSTYICQDIFDQNLEGTYDAIVIVNWIHNIDPKGLKSLFQYLYNNNINDSGYLVFDIIDNKNYKYNHDIEFLIAEFNSSYNVFGPFEYGRYTVFLKKG
jgi:SAM-dependent methyltransferase